MAAFLQSVRFRLLALVLLAIVPALGMALWTGLQHRDTAEQRAGERALQLVYYASQRYESLVESTAHLLEILAADPALASFEPDACQTEFAHHLSERQAYINLGVATREGLVVCSAVPQEAPTDIGDRLYFRQAVQSGGFAIGEYQVGRITQRPSLHFGQAILDPAGGVRGVVFCAVDLGALRSTSVEEFLPESATFALIDRNGTILARHPYADHYVGQKVDEAPLVHAVLAERAAGTRLVRGLDGVERLYGFRPLGPAGNKDSLFVCIGVPATVALADANMLLLRHLLWLGFIAFAVLGLSMIAGRRFLLEPVRSLVRAARAVASGDLHARTGLRHTEGELGQLARSFDEMAAALERRANDTVQAEEWLRLQSAALESADNAVAITDIKGRIIWVNAAFGRLTGYTREEALGQHTRLLRSGVHNEEFYRQMWETILAGKVWTGELVNRRKDGSLYTEEMTITPLRDRQETVTQFIAIKQDITERRRAEEALRESEERFRTLSACSPVGVLLTDTTGHCNYANPRARTILGLSLMETMGEGWLAAVHSFDRDHVLRSWADAISEGREFSREFRIQSSAGVTRWVHLRSSPMLSDSDELIGHVATLEDITERKHAYEALHESESSHRSLVESARDAIFTLSTAGRLTSLNPAFEQITGWPRGDWFGKPLDELLHPDDVPRAEQELRRVLRGETPPAFELRFRSRTGDTLTGEVTVTPQVRNGRVIGLLGIARDITERRRLEQQFFEAQKMEAVGRLAGGVAHDFNNILTAILGFSEIGLRHVKAGSPLHRHLTEIRKAGARATALTRQLLAFSRKQVLEPKVVDLNTLITDSAKMLRRLIGEDISLNLQPGAALGLVKADPGQIDQVLLNLAVNARDAMPQGGSLTIQTANAHLEPGDTPHPDSQVPAGEYVTLTIRDTGLGMDPQVKAHLFEPFFTTKPSGKGTGLGLATCYGIIKQSDGYIAVDSAPGEGTTFTIYLPRVQADRAAALPQEVPTVLPRGEETLLVVEDEPSVRDLVQMELGALGYTVLSAGNGEEALRVVKQLNGHPLDLLLTDVVMPQMGGRELANRLKEIHPGVRVIFASGYTEDAISHHGVLDPGTIFVQKPFTTGILARKIREVLDSVPA